VKLLFLLVSACVVLPAQPVAGSVASRKLLVGGPSVIDSAGNIYTTTGSSADNVATPGAPQGQTAGGRCFHVIPFGAVPYTCENAFIAKFDRSGQEIFGTFLGGVTASGGQALALDVAGNIYLAGYTGSGFPTTDGADIASGSRAAFAAKLSADGSKFLYSTYLPNLVTVTGIAVDAQGSAVIVGANSANHAVVVKLSADGSQVLYTIVLAGSNQDSANGVTIDRSGFAIIAGTTSSPDFPVTPAALQPSLLGVQNAFVTKLDPAGNVAYSTYLGGSGREFATAVQVNSAGSVYVIGNTTSIDLPTTANGVFPAPAIPLWSSSPRGFIAKIAPDGASLEYGSYWYGVSTLALGASGDIYLAGGTGPGALPITPTAPNPCVPGLGSGFLVHLNADGALLEATYINAFDVSPDAMGVLADDAAVVYSSGVSVGGPVVAEVRFGSPGWTAPACMTRNVLQAATFTAGTVVPGEFVAFAGFGIGPENGVAADPSTGESPTSLGGVRVLFDGIPAPVIYAQSRQVNAQVPFEVSDRQTTVISLEFNGAVLGSIQTRVVLANPGLLRLEPGASARALALNQDGSVNGPSNPAIRGSIVTLWGTGFPLLDSACTTGGSYTSTGGLAPGFDAQIYGLGPLAFAGGTPGLPCGLIRMDLQVPLDARPGALNLSPLVVSNNGNTQTGGDLGSLIYVK
jgi:uncharacterized protein (TIGR03437 family)